MTRRFCISFSILSFLLCSFQNNVPDKKNDSRIDRKGLVHRHFPTLAAVDSLSPFTVGNGEFAYTVDVTGLQTFPDYYQQGIPLGTHSQWGWHTMPNPNNYTIKQTFKNYSTYGRQVEYAAEQQSESAQWLRSNPHMLHLGRIGFRILNSSDSEVRLSDITAIHQTVDLWEGIIKSSFRVEGEQITVETACHPDIDQIAVRMRSNLLSKGKVGIRFNFSYGMTSWGKNSTDWNSPDKHTSEIVSLSNHSVTVKRTLDSDKYFVHIQWKGNAKFVRTKEHSFVLSIFEHDQFEFTCGFTQADDVKLNPDVEALFQASKSHWKDFWETGGAIDLSESTDPRARELERRIILSRYVSAIQCAGSMPPQETGLMCNSWYGKSHLEMHWWHSVHFVL